MRTNELIEEIRQLLVEGEFNARWEVIQTTHKIGQLLLEQEPKNMADLVRDTARALKRGERQFWYAVKFAQTFPDLQRLPEGKNVSMNKIITKYLTTPKEKEEHTHTPLTMCSVCHMKL